MAIAKFRFLGLLILVFSSWSEATESPLLYRPESRGALGDFNPISQYLNLAFDTAQNPFYFSQDGFFSNHRVLFDRIKSPGAAISESGGVGTFLTEEFFGLRALPNYTLHLIGGGYDYRLLAEWYAARNYPYPYAIAFFTHYLANIGNEALETTAAQVEPTDHIADLFFFDIVGKLLFLNDDFVRFVRDDLGVLVWHFQPMINLGKFRVDNAGSNYVFRPKWGGEKVRPLVHLGMSILVGASFALEEEEWLSFAIGLAPTDPLELKGDLMAGIYYDEGGDLLASLTLNGTSNLLVRLNLYPDFIRWGDFRPGFFSSVGRQGQFTLGASLVLPIGFSVTAF